MLKVVISDTSTLILFQKIDELMILQKVYGELVTTQEIAIEYGDDLPDWIKVMPLSDKKHLDFLATQVDLGEASAIALASEYDDVLLLLDDLKARKLAAKLNLKFTGILGVLHKAKQMSLIDNIKPMIEKLLSTDFRISENVIKEILKLNNE